MLRTQHPTKRKRFIVELPVWHEHDFGRLRDCTEKMLREAINEAFNHATERHARAKVLPLRDGGGEKG